MITHAWTLTRTSIGKKAVVAVTGAILFGFVVFHTLGNLQVFLGPEALNDYAAALHAIPELLWLARIVLLVSLLVHVGLTIDLAVRNGRARGSRYHVAADHAAQGPLMKYARKTMILSGPIVLAFVAFHVAHLTLGRVPGFPLDPENVYANVVHGFRSPAVTGLYVFANVLLGFHLYQGGHGLLQSLGLRSPRFDAPLRTVAALLAAFVCVGNVIMPLAVLARLVGAELE